MKKSFVSPIRILFLLAFVVLFFASCSSGDGGSTSFMIPFKKVWIVYVCAVCCALGVAPVNLDEKDGIGYRAIARLLTIVIIIAMEVLLIAGFWRWEWSWIAILINLSLFNGVATSTAGSDSHSLPPVLQLIGSIAALGTCIYSYIMLW